LALSGRKGQDAGASDARAHVVHGPGSAVEAFLGKLLSKLEEYYTDNRQSIANTNVKRAVILAAREWLDILILFGGRKGWLA